MSEMKCIFDIFSINALAISIWQLKKESIKRNQNNIQTLYSPIDILYGYHLMIVFENTGKMLKM